MVFDDRRDAGRRLAAQVRPLAGARPVVVAVPRGGVPVAHEIARTLGAPLDVLTVRKLGAPQNPELAVGAVAEDGSAVLDTETARALGVTSADLERILERELRELARRRERFRDGRPPLEVRDRSVILVDDGLATGLSDLAAVRALRRRGAERIVVAVPVGSREAVAMLGEEADEVVCLTVPRELRSVGLWYRDFSPVSDEEVLALLGDPPATIPPSRAGEPAGGGTRELEFDLGTARLPGRLSIPGGARALVIFAHGSGSSARSPRNARVARALNEAGFATLLFDLLSEAESGRRELVFDVALLAGRLEAVTRWAREDPAVRELPLGYFGASTGAAAALWAAARVGGAVRAVVSRGGRPDLAGDRLAQVQAATLLVVGALDHEVLELNRQAAALLRCPHRIAIVDGAGHLFEEPGALGAVARLAIDWFEAHLTADARPMAGAAPGA